jgi:endonuclease/exonuclease/phosphatase family metal-dependent hydrolase
MIMYRMRLWAKIVGNRHSLYADIATPHGSVRAFCLHLPLTHPLMRAEEFERALAHRDPSLPTIVCGDFNVLESLHVTPLNWLSGGRVRDAISARRERRHLEARFFSYALINVFRGRSTHRFSHSQLDHILVPRGFSITAAHVVKRTYGSDHRPIVAEVSPQPHP